MNLGEKEIDQLTCDLLLALHDEFDGQASTTELREYLDLDQTRSIKYRARRYLLDRGLVEEHDPGKDDSGRDLPIRYSLTVRGKEFCETFWEDLEVDEDTDVEERVERLERRVNRMASELRSIQAGDIDD